MQQRRRLLKQNFWAGALMVAFGIGTILEASSYALGSLASMGPGFYPLLLGVILILLGLLIPFIADPDDDDLDEAGSQSNRVMSRARGMLCIAAGMIAFMALGHYGGLAPAIFGLVFIAAMGDASHTVKSAAILAFCTTVAGVLIFSWALELQIPVFRWNW